MAKIIGQSSQRHELLKIIAHRNLFSINRNLIYYDIPAGNAGNNRPTQASLLYSDLEGQEGKAEGQINRVAASCNSVQQPTTFQKKNFLHSDNIKQSFISNGLG